MLYFILTLGLFWFLWQLNIHLKSDKKKSLIAPSTECEISGNQRVEIVKNDTQTEPQEKDNSVDALEKDVTKDETKELRRKISSEILKPIEEEMCNADEVEVLDEEIDEEQDEVVKINQNEMVECIPALVESNITNLDIEEDMKNEIIAGNKIAKEVTEEVEEVDVEVEVRKRGSSEEKESVVTTCYTTKQEHQQQSEIHADDDGNIYRKVVENFEDGEMGTPHIVKEFEDVSCEKNVTKTVVVKQVKNVSFSKEEFRTRSVQVTSVLGSNIIKDFIEDGLQKSPIIAFPSDDVENSDVKKTMYVKTSTGENVSNVSSEDVAVEDCEEDGQDESDELGLRKKKPFGGICMFGGEELLNKIKKRRIEIDSKEEVERRKSESGGVTVETVGYTTSQVNNVTHHETITFNTPILDTDPSICNKEMLTTNKTTNNQIQPDNLISSGTKPTLNGIAEPTDQDQIKVTVNKEVLSDGEADLNFKSGANLNSEISKAISSSSSFPVDSAVNEVTSECSTIAEEST